ncbi:hypothetical protein EJ04DRAFT_580731 [Polyplosphaeria fusca]|uniref:Uncharacterized protein n=1 Tax=Polyplosphaeria fusca TaxID=682080 RepID=A0A9P4QR26_9PLEO|nr:hypothetical protein EJ04DRAFT_580731 [Polyplosphaeria fusca]
MKTTAAIESNNFFSTKLDIDTSKTQINMPDIVFAFGPSHSFYFFAGHTRHFSKIPEQFKRYVLESPENEMKRLKQPQCVALGPTEQEYYTMYQTMEDTDRYTYDFQSSHPELMNWLKPLSKVVGTHVAIGPRRTFYACVPTLTNGGTFYSPSIPADLKSLLDDNASADPNRKFTAQVSLGYGDSWYVLWPNGEVSWDFKGHYDELDTIMETLPEKCILHLVLNPWERGQYFMVLEDGEVKFCLPEEYAGEIEDAIKDHQNQWQTKRISSIKGGKAQSHIVGANKIHMVLKDGRRRDKDGPDAPPPYDGGSV